MLPRAEQFDRRREQIFDVNRVLHHFLPPPKEIKSNLRAGF
jgi:hypothetical protein